MEYAECVFAEQRPTEKPGVPAGAHYRQLRKALRRRKSVQISVPDDPDEKSPPPALQHVWEIFLELHRGRSSNGFSPNSISFADILALQTLYGFRFEPWEVDVYRALDALFLRTWNDRSRGTNDPA